MRRPEEFRDAVRGGARAGCSTLVVHVRPGERHDGAAAHIGFIVNKSVGSAVVRNRVQRRLRHLLASWASDLPAGTLVVVRALPAAADAPGAELARDVDACLRRARTKAERAVTA
jgi:ribonuclease P protein component